MLKEKYKKIIEKDFNKGFDCELKSGWDFDVIIVNNKYVYRFSKEVKSLKDLQKEKKVLDILNKNISFNIPKIDIISGIGFKYKIIEGNTMEKVDFSKLNKIYLEKIINDIVLFLKELHKISIENFNFLIEENSNDIGYRNYLKNQIEEKLIEKISFEKIKKIKDYIDDLFDLDFEKKVLCHTDIQKKNIIYNYEKNKIFGFIDFSDFRLSGRELDFCHFLKWGDDIFKEIIIKYLGFYDENFVNKVEFLAKRFLIFEILNDDIFQNNWEYLKKEINNF